MVVIWWLEFIKKRGRTPKTDGNDGSRRWSEREIVVSVFLSLWLTYAYFVPNPHLNDDANIISRIGLTLSLAEAGSLDIDFIASGTIDKAFYNGHYFCDKAPGASLTALVPVAASVWILKALGRPLVPWKGGHFSALGVIVVCIATLFTSSLFTAAAAAMLYLVARHWDATRGAALFSALSFGLATPAAGQATLFLGHALASACLWMGFATIVFLVDRKEPSRSEIALAFLAGVLLAWAVTVDFTVAPASLVIVLYVIAGTRAWPAFRRRKVVAAAVLASMFAALPLLAYNMAAFDSPFALGYSKVVGFAGMKQGFMGISLPRIDIIYELLFGRYRGILWIAPIGLLWPWALWECRPRLSRQTVGVLFLIPLTFLLINSGYYYWDGGWSTGPRYLTPGLAFICLPLAFLWMAIGRAWRSVVLALAGLSGFVTLICVSIDMTAPQKYTDPLFEYLLPRFLEGRVYDAVTMGFAYQLRMRNDGLYGWQGLATLAFLPATWIIVMAMVRRLHFSALARQHRLP